MNIDKEKAIRAIVSTSVSAYASGFSDRHILEKDNEDGVINMKIHNVFISQREMHNFFESSICMSPERLKSPKHPTQKPVGLLKKIIAIASNENDTVLDPFMGVGSVGVASLMLNRKFIGFEIDESYFKAAEIRLQQEFSI